MKNKKRGAAVIAALLGISMLAGCGNNAAVQNEAALNGGAGDYPITQEKITLSIFTPKSQYVEDYSTNEFTKWLEEKTNIAIEWQTASGDLAQSKNVMLASGNYPDVMMNCSINRSEQLVYGEQGIFIDLTDLINEHTVNIKAMLEERPEVRSLLETPQGKIFGLPKINDVYHSTYSSKMWVYQPWLDKLGLETPTTTEEFYQMLKAFKERDPNGNGLADEIPMAATSKLGYAGIDEFLLNSFVYCNDDRMMVENGTVKFVGDTEEYREGLRYLNRLYNEGLLLKDSLVMDRKALTSLGENPDVPILGSAPSLWFGMFTIAGGDSGRYKDYKAIAPLAGPTGLRQTPKKTPAYSGDSFNITQNCKNTIAAIRWADYFYSMEGTLTSQCGQENVGWKKAEEGQLGLDGNPAIWVTMQRFGSLQNSNWTNSGLFNFDEKMRLGMAAEEDDETEKLLYDTTKELYEPYGADKSIPELFFNQEQSIEFTELETQIKSEIEQSLAAFVSGEKSLDNDWDSYLKRLDDMGLKRYVELYQSVYDENFKN